jgi:hypothetical protein
LYGEHREVVALLGITYEAVYLLTHLLNELLRLVLTIGEHAVGYLEGTLITKLGMLCILGLCQSIGEKEDGGLWVNVNLLDIELEFGGNAQRQIGQTRQFSHLATYEQR